MSKHDVRATAHPTITPPPPSAAEWMPLDALVAQWADFAQQPEAVSALTLELIGDAFLALAAEMSAHKEYILFQGGSLRERPGTTPGPPTPSIPRTSPTSPMSADAAALVWCLLAYPPVPLQRLTRGWMIAFLHAPAPAATMPAPGPPSSKRLP